MRMNTIDLLLICTNAFLGYLVYKNQQKIISNECYPLVIEVYEPARDLSNWESSRLNEYNRTHGI